MLSSHYFPHTFQVPLYAGASDALASSYDDYRSGRHGFNGTDGFNDVAFDSDPEVGDFVDPTLKAADAIRKIVNQHPGGGNAVNE